MSIKTTNEDLELSVLDLDADSPKAAHRASEERASVSKRREEIAAELRTHVAKEIGPIAKPRDVVVVEDVPKTRSGKIMRRLLTQLFEGTTLGGTTSLQNEPSIAGIQTVLRERNDQPEIPQK